MTRQKKREQSIIDSIQAKLEAKSEEISDLFMVERQEIWDAVETPQIKPQDEKRSQLEQEYDAIYNELQMALEDYGWNK